MVRRFFTFLALLLFCGLVAAWHFQPYRAARFSEASLLNRRMSRPYGMAPAAFNGFVRACNDARVRPYRITQTIGNNPMSVGYHHRDGIVFYRGEHLDYSAATDLETADLKRAQIGRLLEALATQGFAAFYREGGKWRGREHIHAIYAPLSMKWQLQSQVREWEFKRRLAGKRWFHWQKRCRQNWS